MLQCVKKPEDVDTVMAVQMQAVSAMILCLAVSNDHSMGLAKALCLEWPCSDVPFAPSVCYAHTRHWRCHIRLHVRALLHAETS